MEQMEVRAGPVELPDSEIARLVVARTFLGELENCITQQHFTDYIHDKSGRLGRRFERQFNFIDQLIPVAWHHAALAAENLVPEWFQAKLTDPQNSDHNRQHLAHVGNNVIVGSAYDLSLSSFSGQDLVDSTSVLMFDAFTHDHLQIDKHIKDGHDYLGGLFVAGLMRLARLKWNLPYTERQESLAFFSVYWHSYPEKMTEFVPSVSQLFDVYGEKFGINEPVSLLYWLKDELGKRNVDLAGLDCRLNEKDMFLAKWLSHRLAAGDKRASYAPPFMSVLRTMATGEKPFISSEFLGQPLEYFVKNIRHDDVVARTIFEDFRDLRQAGFSAFEINWLKENKVKKLDYLVKTAGVLAGNEKELIVEKFQKYCQEVIYESFRERSINADTRTWLLSLLPDLLFQNDFTALTDLPVDLAATVQLIAHDCVNAKKLMSKKSQELRGYLKNKGMSKEQFMSWLTGLVNEVKANGNLKVVGRYAPVPENMPVYCVSLGVIK